MVWQTEAAGGLGVLNDLKEWAIEKTEETKEVATGVANEVQTTGVMDWSTTVWMVIGGFALLMIIGASSR
ncbi:hypothetical protein EOC93_22255 [Mesorhizobium sp. M6A.T.Ce.TU.002.03.1.1]|uniref:hypothetical protein n=1 Tax=unclassified Mesorhizobium TaxID=325217 RepID=UPI000FCCAD71|nr:MULTISPECIES: hypothetical protein [unclassified Mesorhizobium]RUU39353.1 hypothetical protein EOC93_22255 [Mesorhizobium sp. M6A.T.Ce.TU.002.03.1.1]RWQ64467.1 MAG: hypothetical protein EOS86_19455 [Mesorhizobium sp.]